MSFGVSVSINVMQSCVFSWVYTVLAEGCDTSGNLVRSGRNLVRSGRNQLEIIGNQLEITEIWLEIRNQDPVEIRKSARNHKKSSRNNEKHPLFV